MILNRVPIVSNLSETALEDLLSKGVHAKLNTLVVSSSDIDTPLANKFHLTLQLDTNLPESAWYIHGDYHGYFSPGV